MAAVLFVPGNGGSAEQVRSLGHEMAVADHSAAAAAATLGSAAKKQRENNNQTAVFAVDLGEELASGEMQRHSGAGERVADAHVGR